LHERFPPPSDAYATAEFRAHMGRRIEAALQQADRVIAVSESVRQHLLRYDPSLSAKVRVVHHGVSEPAAPTKAREALQKLFDVPPDQPFFLSVGAVQTRKNISGIVLALKSFRELSLIVAGADGYGAAEIRELVRREGMQERVRFLGHVPHERLPFLYGGATALVFPSFEEAFGLPVLEAMSYGLPVITSDTSAMPEVVGDAALLVDPHSVGTIREAMRRIADEPELVQTLREKGRARAREFTWERCAARTWAVYEELLQGSN
jgi:glycosyltransferase involved in cell wall biosynthesis